MDRTLRPGLEIERRYVLYERIGDGAFGVVWKAHARRRGLDVALKFMREELAKDPALRERFDRETRVLQKIQHPNVVEVLDSGEWNDTPYLVTAFVPGGTLQAWLASRAEKALSLDTVRALLQQICDGLSAAHRQGIVHRDLKPANILLMLDEARAIVSACVADFGLAREESNDQSVSSRAGTMAYASPEQATGKSHTATAASDVFALAVVTLELLTGSCFADTEDNAWWTASLARQIERRLDGRRRLRPEIPEAVWSHLAQSLSHDPKQRPADAAQFASALDAAFRAPAAPSPVSSSSWVMDTKKSLADFTSMGPVTPSAPAPIAVAHTPAPPPSKPAPPAEATARFDSAARNLDAPRSQTARWIAAGAGLLALTVAAIVGLRSATPAERPSPPVDAGRLHEQPPPTTTPTANRVPDTLPSNCAEGMVLIAGGTLAAGGSLTGTVQSFCLDRTEVRVRDFRARASGLRPTPSVNWEGITDAMHREWDRYCTLREGMRDADDLPVNCIDWDLAQQFCALRGARLPTRAEWEFAARGAEGRTYPWGDPAPDATRLNACGAGECPRGALFDGSDGFAMPAPVGQFTAGATPGTGLLDLAGNVAEWLGDTVENDRAVRGGGFRSRETASVRGASEDRFPPSDRRPDVGFRCAADVTR